MQLLIPHRITRWSWPLRGLLTLVWSWLSCFPAQAGFSDIEVQMQSGVTAALTSLPWFEFARGLSVNQYRSQAQFFEWSVHASPSICPFHYYWQVRTRDSIAPHLETGRQKCDETLKKRLAHLPESVHKVCACRLILQTESISKVGQRARWVSSDDALLQLDELRIARTLHHGSQSMPVLVSLGGQMTGIYDYSGRQLCKPVENQAAQEVLQSGRRSLTELMSSGKKIRVNCLDRWAGVVDSSAMGFNLLNQKITGEIVLQLDSGERYVVAE